MGQRLARQDTGDVINPAGAVRQLARRDCETPQAAVTNRQGDKHRWNSVPVIEHVFWRVACRTSHDIGQLLTHQVQARAPRMVASIRWCKSQRA